MAVPSIVLINPPQRAILGTEKLPNEIHTALYIGVTVRARMDKMVRMERMDMMGYRAEMARISLP